jgi:hypothetical protein
MTQDTDIGAAGGAMPEADAFTQEFEAARAAQSDPIGTAEAERAEPADGRGERPPLSPEEIQKRWTDSKIALRQERRARQAQAQRAAALETELSSLRQQMQGGPPDPREDPQAALEYLHARVAEGDAAHETFHARQHEAAQVHRLAQQFTDYEAEFRETVPDYDEAARFLRDMRIGELTQLGLDEAAAMQVFTGEVLASMQDVVSQGINPARYAYVLALQSGFADGGGGASRGGGRLDTIARGQAAAKTLSGPGGRSTGELTYESVANLKGDAFDAAFKRLTAQERERERRG